jgi:hypothetical protein
MIAKPMNKLNQPHTTFTTGADRPRPGGFANGVGNASPPNPAVRCGTALQISRPDKKLKIINRTGIGGPFPQNGRMAAWLIWGLRNPVPPLLLENKGLAVAVFTRRSLQFVRGKGEA